MDSLETSPPRRSPQRERLLSAVADISPLLTECAPEAERERRLPLRAVEAMRDADLFRCAAATVVGGLEVDPLTQIEIFEATAAVDGAAGWNLMIGSVAAAFTASRVDDDAAEAIYAGPRWPILAGLVWPRGRAVPDGDGYRLSGSWSFASGIHQADWVFGGAFVPEDGKPRSNPDGTPRLHIAVVRRGDVTIEDNWHVAGLRGTGSCDFSVDDVAVAPGFVWGVPSQPRRARGWASLPGTLLVPTGHAGFALGIAKGVLSYLESTIASSRRTMSPSATGERESFQLELGRHATRYDAARTLALDAHRELWEAVEGGSEPLEPQVRRINLSALYATETAVAIAHFAFRAAGTAALFESSPIQRALRDILAAQQHVAVRDSVYADFGRARIATAESPGE